MENYSDNIYHCDSDVVVYFVTFNASFSRLDSLGKASAAYVLMYTVSKKKTVKIVFSELCQISINFDNFWHKDGQGNKIV